MNKNIAPLKPRDHSIDMAKGLLIAMLIFHHINDTSNMVGVDNSLIEYMKLLQRPFIVCYFMPAFFLISGMCSNFNKDLKSFIVNQIKGLLIPAVAFILLFHIYQGESLKTLCGTVMRLFLYGKDYWFLVALFEAKILYYFLRKIFHDDKALMIVLGLSSFAGAILNDLDLFENIFMHRHMLDLMLFLGVGHVYKQRIQDTKIMWVSIVLFCVVVLFFMFIQVPLPYVTYTFATSPFLWPVHVILAVSGSVFVVALCKRLPTNGLVEYMGRNSLAIFLMQWYTLIMFMECFMEHLDHAPIKESVILVAVIFVSTISIGLFVAYLTNTTKLRVLMGKF